MAGWINATSGRIFPALRAWPLLVGMGFLLPGVGPALASDVETRDFTVQVDGKAAGEYHMTISRHDDGTVSLLATSEVKVSVLLVNVYTYAYRGQEVWKDGRLQHFESSGKENGKAFAVTADADAAGLHVRANGQAAWGPSGRSDHQLLAAASTHVAEPRRHASRMRRRSGTQQPAPVRRDGKDQDQGRRPGTDLLSLPRDARCAA